VWVSFGAAASGGVRQNLEKSFLGGMAFLSGDASTSDGNDLCRCVDSFNLTKDETDSDRKVNLGRLAVEERSVIRPGTLFLRGVSDVLTCDRETADPLAPIAGDASTEPTGRAASICLNSRSATRGRASGSRRTPNRNSRPSRRQFLATAENCSRCHLTVTLDPTWTGAFRRMHAPDREVSSSVAEA